MGVRPPAFTLAAVRAAGARGGNAAEHHGTDVAHALGDELHVGAMVRADHGIGHHAGQQRFDGRENRDGEAVGQLLAEQIEAQLGQLQLRNTGVDGVEVADGVHVHAQTAHHGDSCEHRDERAGDALAHTRPQHEHRQAHETHDERLDVEGGEIGDHSRELVHRLDSEGACRIREAEQILELARHDGHRDARREARGDGVGHEADERAQAENAHEDQQHARDDGRGHQAVHAARGDDARHDGGERGGGTRDLNRAAAEQRDDEARDDGGIKALLGADARSDGQGDRQRQRHDGHHDAGDDVARYLALELFRVLVLDDAEEDGLDLVARHMGASRLSTLDVRAASPRRMDTRKRPAAVPRTERVRSFRCNRT